MMNVQDQNVRVRQLGRITAEKTPRAVSMDSITFQNLIEIFFMLNVQDQNVRVRQLGRTTAEKTPRAVSMDSITI